MKKSLLLKIAGISCALLVAAILGLSILSVRSIQTSSLQAAVLMGRNKLIGDIASFEDRLALQHGKISLINDELADERGNSLKYNYDIVDHISSRLGVHATIFLKEGGDFRRITTSIIDSSGKRAVDTFLGTDSAVYNTVSSGNDYFGNAVILGKDYLTAYRPLFAEDSREIIGILFIGIEMSNIEEYIINARNSNIISIVFGAVIILILSVLVNVASCRIMLLKPIRAVMDMLKDLRDGNLVRKLAVQSKDEIGEMISHINDTVEKVKSMVESLEEHSRLLDTANEAAVILLANEDLSAFETSLVKCFDLIGRRLDADRVQIWRNDEIDGEPRFALRYEWLSDYGKNCKSIPQDLHFPYSMRKEWHSKFLNHEYINSPVCALPDEDRAFLEPYEMKSIIILPMFLESNFWGFFSIDDCRRERAFSEEEINVITSAGLMMTSAVNRNIQSVKMREAEERIQIMIDAAPLCAIFWDKNIKMLDCNQEVVKMFGVSNKQEFIDKFTEFSPEYQPDGILSVEKGPVFVKQALDEGYSRFEWMHRKLNGEFIPAEVTCIRVKYKDEYTVTEYIRDLREQKAMIAEMRKAEIAEESNKAKSDFLARVSHEIRTPMNAILGIAEIQLQDEIHSPDIKEAFERIYNSGNLLLGIINDILDLSKIEAGKLVLSPAQYDIASLIHDTVQINIMRYEAKSIEFILDVNENLPLLLIGDELRIKQILNNLLSNAFKYTEKGTVKLAIYSEPEDTNDASKTFLVFIISDTGQGMTPDQVKKLGTEYSRFNMEANRKTEGTGLGMNITLNLIQLMNGGISVESVPGTGSTFTVRLPQDIAATAVLGKELADNLMGLNLDNSVKLRAFHMKKEYMPYGSVLVVDDVETNLYVARGLLAPYGLLLETAISGFEAIEKIKNGNTYDIIFMDHMMPRMDGIEAAKIIRNLGYSKPIVALTANAISGQAAVFMENGFDDFISKPIDIRQLNVVLNKLIRDKYPADIVKAARNKKALLYSGDIQENLLWPELAEMFNRDAKRAITVMEAIYSNRFRRDDDVSMFIINIHAIKSALANVGEIDLSIEALNLEEAGREKNVDLLLTELPPFLEKLRAIIKKLEPQKDTGNNQENEYDYLFLKEKLLLVKEACAAYNKKPARDALAEIKKRTWPESVYDQLGGISDHLLHSDFDEAIQAIDECMSRL